MHTVSSRPPTPTPTIHTFKPARKDYSIAACHIMHTQASETSQFKIGARLGCTKFSTAVK